MSDWTCAAEDGLDWTFRGVSVADQAIINTLFKDWINSPTDEQLKDQLAHWSTLTQTWLVHRGDTHIGFCNMQTLRFRQVGDVRQPISIEVHHNILLPEFRGRGWYHEFVRQQEAYIFGLVEANTAIFSVFEHADPVHVVGRARGHVTLQKGFSPGGHQVRFRMVERAQWENDPNRGVAQFL